MIKSKNQNSFTFSNDLIKMIKKGLIHSKAYASRPKIARLLLLFLELDEKVYTLISFLLIGEAKNENKMSHLILMTRLNEKQT